MVRMTLAFLLAIVTSCASDDATQPNSKPEVSDESQTADSMMLQQTTISGTIRGVNLYCLVGTNTPQVTANCIEIAQVIDRIYEPYIESHLRAAMYFLSRHNVNWIRTVLWADFLPAGNYPNPSPQLIAKYNRFAAILAEHGMTINFMLIGPMVRLVGAPPLDLRLRDTPPYNNDKTWISAWVDGVMAGSSNIGNILILGDATPCDYGGRCWPEHNDIPELNINHAKYLKEMWPWFRARYPNYQAGFELATSTYPPMIRGSANWAKKHAPDQSYFYATLYEHTPLLPFGSEPIKYAQKAVAAIDEFDRAQTGLNFWVDEYGMGVGGQWGDRQAQSNYFNGTLHALSCHYPGRNFPKFVWDFGPNPNPYGYFGVTEGYGANGEVIPASSWGTISHFYRRVNCSNGEELASGTNPVPSTVSFVAETYMRYLNRPASQQEIEIQSQAIADGHYSHLRFAELIRDNTEAIAARRNAIIRAFATYLKRAAVESDIAAWDALLRDSLSFAGLEDGVAYSPEGLQLLVSDTFIAMFGTPASPRDISFWVDAMAGRIITREAFVAEISYTEAALRYLIRGAFLTFLKREPNEADYAFRLDLLQRKVITRENLVISIRDGEESATLLVRETYLNYLGWTVSDRDLAFWVDVLMRQIRTREQFVDEMSHTEAALRYLIRGAFLTYLKREPNDVDYAFRLDLLQRRVISRENLVISIRDGEESANLIVRETFLAFLGREATASDLAFWSGALIRGELTREAFVDQIRKSPESRNTVRLRITQHYAGFLGRAASSSDLDAWESVYIVSTGLEAIRKGIECSLESITRAVTIDLRVKLNREPSSAEIKAAVDERIGRQDCLSGLLSLNNKPPQSPNNLEPRSTGIAEQVSKIFQNIFKRVPTPAELSEIITKIGKNASDAEIEAKVKNLKTSLAQRKILLKLRSGGVIPQVQLRFIQADAAISNFTFRKQVVSVSAGNQSGIIPDLEFLRLKVSLSFNYNGRPCSFEGIVGWQEIAEEFVCK